MGISIKGQKTWLKEVAVEDAEGILNLRNDDRINKYLSTSRKVTVPEQEEWIKNNLKKTDGYYFKVMELGSEDICGTASIYNIDNGGADFGRYICVKPVQAVETEYLVLDYGFNTLGLERLYCRVVMENKKVWKQHHTFGFRDTGEETMITPDKELKILVQELSKQEFNEKDYSAIQNLIQRF